MAVPVLLATDPALMDGKYLTACFQKAARLRKHDPELFRGLCGRALELRGDLDATDWGYILWGIGKSRYLGGGSNTSSSEEWWNKVREVFVKDGIVGEMGSHALMGVMWCLRRLQRREKEVRD